MTCCFDTKIYYFSFWSLILNFFIFFLLVSISSFNLKHWSSVFFFRRYLQSIIIIIIIKWKSFTLLHKVIRSKEKYDSWQIQMENILLGAVCISGFSWFKCNMTTFHLAVIWNKIWKSSSILYILLCLLLFLYLIFFLW